MEGTKGKQRKGHGRVTFKLVSASYSDPRVSENPFQRTLVLKGSQNDTWKNRDRSTIPKEFLSLINPADFGIHKNLPHSQKDELIKEIYGTREEYEKIAAKFAHLDASHKPSEEDLDSDCYFPKDGYDYSQHLATITPQNFIPAVKKSHEDPTLNANLASGSDFPSLHDAGRNTCEDQDVAEVLHALEYDASDLEAMDDDFVAKAMDNQDPDTFIDENELLWGGYKPLRKVMFESNQLFGADARPHEDSVEMAEDDQFYEAVDEEDEGDNGSPAVGTTTADNIPDSLMEMLKNNMHGHHGDEKDTMDVLDPEGGRVSEQILQLLEHVDESDNSDNFENLGSSSDESEQWDVQTVLTKYTNATNHPQRIRTNIVQKVKTLEKGEVQGSVGKPIEDVEYVELPPVVTTRNRNETPEERRARKAAVKQAKSLITRMKKANKEALKEAKKKATDNNSRGSYDIINGVKYIRLT